MSTAKTAKTYTVEELKEKAKLAAAVPRLVEIVRNAPLEEGGKMNLTAVRDRAHQYILEQTGDVKDAKKLADSTRFLAMLRRDHAEEFDKLVAQKEQSKKEAKTKMPKKLFHQIEFYLEPSIESITRESKRGQDFRQNWRVERCIRFRQDSEDLHLLDPWGVYSPRGVGKKFCMEILNALIETADPPGNMDLMRDLIQFLEEKFGLKVKVSEEPSSA